MIDQEKVGKAIAYLRKRSGFTQKDLSDRLGISDKAVSKWERGIGLPDVSLISKLAILLDTDSDSLLRGDAVQNTDLWNGVLIFSDDEIRANTVIYDKPISSYLLSYFLLVGIRKIYIQSSEEDRLFFQKEYGDGSKLGVELIYNPLEEKLVFSDGCTNVMTVFGKSFIYGVDQTRFFKRAMTNRNNTVVLSLPKESECDNVCFDEDRKVTEDGKLNTQYSYYHIPVAFMPSDRFNTWVERKYEFSRGYYTELLDRGFVEILIGSIDDVIDASQFVKTVQKYCEMHIYCIEEIAWRRGLISMKKFLELAEEKEKTEYGQYLIKICQRNELSE